MDAMHAALHATRVLDDAAVRAPQIARELPDDVRAYIRYGRGTLTEGIPRFTWNGLDETGRLFPGIHPATAGELELRFAWNPQRQQFFTRMQESLAAIRADHPQLRYVAGGGSYFSGKAKPGDIDLALLADEPGLAATRRLNDRDAIVHVYPAQGHSSGVPQYFIEKFRFERATGPGQSRAERGMVLFDLDDLLAGARQLD